MALFRCGSDNNSSTLDVQVAQHGGYAPAATVTSLNISIDNDKRYGWGWAQAGSDPTEANINVIIENGQVIWTSSNAASLNITVNNGKLEGDNFATGFGGAWTLYTL